MTLFSTRSAKVLGLLLACTLCFAATLPDVSYRTTTTFKVSGVLGKILAKTAPDEIVNEVMLQHNRMVTQSENTRSIVDLDAQTITTVDDQNQTFTVMTFDDLRAMMENSQMEAASQENAEESGEPTANVEMDFELDRTGTWETINGYNAERVLLTIYGDVESEEENTSPMMQGQFVLVMEMWMSAEVPGYQEMQDFQQRYAEKMGEALFQNSNGESITTALSAIMGNDPRLEESLERAQQEAAGLEGMAVRTTTHIVTVPQDLTYDPERVFAEEKAEEPEEKKKKGGLGGFANRLAKKANALAEGSGNTGQRTILKMMAEYDGFSTSTVSDSAFEIDPSYTEKPFRSQ